MALTFYYGSGSPYAWTVWLALEHKGVPYDFKLMSFDKGDLATPEFRKINPRGQVPAIVHDGFALWESVAIVEYLEERFPEKPLLPKDAKGRATARRMMLEAHNHFAKAENALLGLTMFRDKGALEDAGAVAAAQDAVAAELERWAAQLSGDFLVGALSLADFTVYPYVRMLRRLEDRMPGKGLAGRIPAKIEAWTKRIEALPYYAKTTPPHWQK